jgi:hypothetical protein
MPEVLVRVNATCHRSHEPTALEELGRPWASYISGPIFAVIAIVDGVIVAAVD